MVLAGQWRPDDVDEPTLMRAVALCNDAVRDPGTGAVLGDPTEVALLQAAADHGTAPEVLAAALPRVDEVPFDSVRKRMTTVHRGAEGLLVLCKGAPDALLTTTTLCEPDAVLDAARRRAEQMAADGDRVLAVAQRWVSTPAGALEGDGRLPVEVTFPRSSRGSGCWGWSPCTTPCVPRPAMRWRGAARPASTWRW